jgi:photosystem II stability/assembly factor-like uncharacterized protein
MKLRFFFLLLIILVLCLICSAFSQEILTADDFTKLISKGTVVYSTSFETDEDTSDWYGLYSFSDDVPEGGGQRSAFISGGCVWPHAWKKIGPLEEAGNYIVRCKAKNLDNGGMISIAHIQDSGFDVYLAVTDTGWASYQTHKQLYCNAGDIIILSLNSGGYVSSSMLVDMIEVVNAAPQSSGWTIIGTGTSVTYNDVMMLNETTAFIAGSGNTLLKTTDAGTTWTNIAPILRCANGPIPDWFAVRFYTDSTGIALEKTNIIITTDGGEAWTSITPAGGDFTCMGNTGPDNIYVGDDRGYIHYSNDTGKTWNSEPVFNLEDLILIDSLPIKAIFSPPDIFDGMTLLALTPDALYYKGQMPGGEWKKWGTLGYFTTGVSEACDAFYTSDGTLFICGISEDTFTDFAASGLVIRLRMPDSYWQPVLTAGSGIFGLASPFSGIIYTCGTEGKIFKTSDNGSSWNIQYTGIEHTLNSINFYNNSGFAVGDSGTILYTKTGGEKPVNSPPLEFHLLSPANEDSMGMPYSLVFTWSESEDSDGDVISYSLLFSEDSCKTWKSYGPVTNTSISISGPGFPGRYYWTVIAADGMSAVPASEVFSFNIVTIAGVSSIEDIPRSFTLYQNYPNPFNPSTKIKYDVPAEEKVTIKIYDILGNEIAVLVNEYMKRGSYVTGWNAENLPSGIYFCAIKAGRYKNTIKLSLVK